MESCGTLIYTGIILATVALAVVKGTAYAAAGALLVIIGFWIKARLEEGFLRKQLGAETYDDYCRRVPMLIPFAPGEGKTWIGIFAHLTVTVSDSRAECFMPVLMLLLEALPTNLKTLMSISEYILALMSIVVGLAMTQLLSGAAEIAQRLKPLRTYWIHTAWMVYLFVTLIHFWWWEFGLMRILTWTFLPYAFVICFAVLLYFLVVLLVPSQLATKPT